MEQRAQAPSLIGLWDGHGDTAYALALALLGDEMAAAEAVRLAMVDLVRSAGARPDAATDGEASRALARSIHRHAAALPSGTPATDRLPRPMVWLSQLAWLQRASIALCVYGRLTHREAAALLDVPPATVAGLLTAGLRELSRLAVRDGATLAS